MTDPITDPPPIESTEPPKPPPPEVIVVNALTTEKLSKVNDVLLLACADSNSQKKAYDEIVKILTGD